MRSFVGAFASPMLTLAGITTMHASFGPGNSFQLRTIGSSKTRRLKSDGQEETEHLEVHLRPDFAEYDVGVEHRRREPGEEQDSLASHGSEQLIIRRDTHRHFARGGPPSLDHAR